MAALSHLVGLGRGPAARRAGLCLLLGLAGLSVGGCGSKVGPRPLVNQVRVSAPGPEGTVTIWGRIQNNFKDAKPGADAAALMEELNDEVAFEVTTGGARDRLYPALVPTTAVQDKTTDATWRDRLTVDFLLFPKGIDSQAFKLLVTNFYEEKSVDPTTFELEPASSTSSQPVVKSVEVTSVGNGRSRITVVLDRDATATLTVWHQLGGRVHRIEKKGARLFVREFKDSSSSDHKVVLVSGEDWISPPATPASAPAATEDEEEE